MKEIKINGLDIYKTIRKSLHGYGLGNFYPIKKLNGYLMKSLKKDKVVVQGHTMFLDKNDGQSLTIDENFEPKETIYAMQNINKGDIVLDLGACIGYYTLIFARLVGDTGKVYAFEPNPENFTLLKKNIEYNSYKNVVLINKAVSNENEIVTFFLSESNNGAGSLRVMYDRINKLKTELKTIEVETIKLDDYFKTKKVNFIKMDIEGAEYVALEGMKKLLERSKSVKMITEYQPLTLAVSGIQPSQFIELIKKLGFEIHNPQNKAIEDYKIGDGSWTNLFCEKNDK